MTRSAALLFLAVFLVIIFLPALAVSLGRQKTPFPAGEDRFGEEEGNPPPAGAGLEVRLYRHDLGAVISLDLEEYLVGVVMAEMPASFGLEALKAQAVAARTYTLHRHRLFGGSGCGKAPAPADICSDSTHCQAWVDPAGADTAWPEGKAKENLARIREAVRETASLVITYRGKLIEAVYHSTCGGYTEASQAVWSGSPVPYLQSVACPHCEHSPYYRQEVFVPYEQLAEALPGAVTLPVSAGQQIPLAVKRETPGGRIGVLSINGVEIEGKVLREKLGLPSTAFTWERQADGLLLTVRGHGHGVGLCQYGADGMAAAGEDYRTIIAFYYPGTAVTPWEP